MAATVGGGKGQYGIGCVVLLRREQWAAGTSRLVLGLSPVTLPLRTQKL
jgi:hypothetical protein